MRDKSTENPPRYQETVDTIDYIGAPFEGSEMKIFTRISPLQEYLDDQRFAGKNIGLVPTMGALHRGHSSLVQVSHNNGDFTVCSLFVNPTQFNDAADLAKYPRSLAADKDLLIKAGCKALFVPDDIEMYANPSKVRFDFGNLDKELEGKYRPGHFSGVALVVSKLFNIFRPHNAYFGQKDFQQFKIISLINSELLFGIHLHCLPTIREEDGLAMSSRNLRLNSEERKRAASLYSCLSHARKALITGESWSSVRVKTEAELRLLDGVTLEYFELVDKETLSADNPGEPDNCILLIAAYVGQVRLIDNLSIS